MGWPACSCTWCRPSSSWSLRGGIGVVAKLSASGVLVGTIIPGLLLVVLGVLYLLVVSNFGAYAGMEMNAVHVNELEDPRRQFPKSCSWPWRWCWSS